MGYVAVPSVVGAKGYDTSLKLDKTKGAALVGAGADFVIRYLPLGSTFNPALDLDPKELDALTSAGLAVMAVQFARTSGWNAASGQVDGANAAKGAIAAGIPLQTTVWLDFECGAQPSNADAIGYANAWQAAAISGGLVEPGIYVGPGIGLSGAQLFQQLHTKRYWKSGASVPQVESRGFQMYQGYPGNLFVNGVEVDADWITDDFYNTRPVWCVRTVP